MRMRNAVVMKAMAMSWLRFQKQYHYIGTEIGVYNADVMGSNGKDLIEVEVKVSSYDFKIDFKKEKHAHYKKAAAGGDTRHIPNKFYFVVPEDEVKECQSFMNRQKYEWEPEVDCRYGLISYDPEAFTRDAFRIVQPAKTLHKNPPHESTLTVMVKRMSSELTSFHLKKFMDFKAQDFIKQCVNELVEFPDIEYPFVETIEPAPVLGILGQELKESPEGLPEATPDLPEESE